MKSACAVLGLCVICALSPRGNVINESLRWVNN
uniref:Uncharacterized protein n=1 Tax=Siphoviridae sp. ctJ7x27 TaxID=2827835 RepID=A0A8S5S4S0_9CAUD|nr:MAG TPA: hypothetical protein [Siphoviridae sp. ctJ7x27]